MVQIVEGQPQVAAVKFPIYRMSQFNWRSWIPETRLEYTLFIGIDDTVTPAVYSLRYTMPGVAGGIGQTSELAIDQFLDALREVQNRQDSITTDFDALNARLTQFYQDADRIVAEISTSAVAASVAASEAKDWANLGEDEVVDESGEFSAKHYAAKAATTYDLLIANEDIMNAADNAASASNSARVSRLWATGSDPEVQELEADEHSSRTYSNIAMAIANTPEDVPILESQLLGTDVVKGEKGDKGDTWTGGVVTENTTFKGDDNHPLNVEGMAGVTPSGIQLTDSLGAGESYFEHYNTGDRYGTKIRNKNNTTGQTVEWDLYQTNAGKSVLDLSDIDTILVPQLLDMIYPIGSYYLSEEDSCPLADWMEDCLWEKVGTTLVSGTSAPVVGNGITLGLTDGTTNTGMITVPPQSNASYGGDLNQNTGAYGTSVGSRFTSGTTGLNSKSMGITTDPDKSGIVANLPTIQVNIFRRVQ